MNYIETFIETLESDCTKKSYRKNIENMLDYIKKPIEDIKRIDLTKWNNSLKHLSTATQAQKIASVKSYFRFLYDNEIIQTNPADNLKSPKIHNKPKDAISKEEALEMLKWGTYRDRAIVAVYLSTGLRVQEVIDLKLEDYLNNSNILKVRTKGGKYRTVILNNDCKKYIDKYLETRVNGVENLFTTTQGTKINKVSLNKTLQRMADKAGINKHITNHTLRATFITDITKNYGIYVAQEAVKHSNIETTRRYVRGLEGEVEEILGGLSL